MANTTAIAGATVCKELPAWGVPVGIGLSVAGSIGINVGQNLQAAGIAHLPEELRTKPFKSKVWQLGMGLFVVFSMVNFAALALAPASILTPIESIQFVTNIAYNKFVNHSSVRPKMLAGVCCALLGTVRDVLNHGAGDLLEVAPPGGGETVLLPFTLAAVPTVDLGSGRIVADPPEGLFAG